MRGGSAFDGGEALVKLQGYINGLVYDPNALAASRPLSDLLQASDMVKLGLAGSIRDYPLETFDDKRVELREISYGGQPAGFASAPGEVVNYVENHDNQTLFDICVFKLPPETSTNDRARVQVLGAAFKDLIYLINVDKVSHSVKAAAERAKPYALHPVHRATGAADKRAATARFDRTTGTFTVPPRTAVVFVVGDGF